MSGHSKWTQIKRQKAVTDQRRGNLFTKMANTISAIARQGGKDPSMNFRLRMAIDKARESNMPNENIERAIARGSGEIEGVTIEEVMYEGFGPHGTALIIDVTTDNKNRTASEIRSILAKYHGSLGNTGSVAYMFTRKGVIRIPKTSVKDKDEFTLKMIDSGADDIADEEEGFTIYTAPHELQKVSQAVGQAGLILASTGLEMVPTSRVTLPDEPAKKQLSTLLEELEANDDVSDYFTNAEL
ncbi:MAG: YebC/PmpR family DNA-binding transcriptional regulator [Patescibacteria group bacterium]